VLKGRLIIINEIREALAKEYEKDGFPIVCPITIGVFAWIAAHAAEEAKT